MSIQVKRRGGTTAAHTAFVGAEREITVDTDKYTAIIHDGETLGGFPLAREDMNNISDETIKARAGFIAAGLTGVIFCAPLDSLDGCLLCDGSAVSRTDYAGLFEKLDESFGAGDGETTFNLPDYRGYFLRGLGGDSATSFSTAQSDAIRNITGTVSGLWGDLSSSGAFSSSMSGGNRSTGESFSIGALSFSAANSVPTATENRPLNFAVNFFIKY